MFIVFLNLKKLTEPSVILNQNVLKKVLSYQKHNTQIFKYSRKKNLVQNQKIENFIRQNPKIIIRYFS